jgi:polyisoprenoid-binding protein YceI
MNTITQDTAGTATWTIDPTHTTVEFSARHMMITTVKGRFGGVTGTIRSDASNPSASGVEVELEAASLDTRTEQRDQHLRSADFLDVENHPSITFRSTRIEGSHREPGDTFRVAGELTIRGTTREVVLDVVYEGSGTDPWGGDRASFSATGTIDRREFGLTWNTALETGGVLVGNEIRISIEAQAVRAD